MAAYRIFTDSSCDLTKGRLDELGIGLISYFVNADPDPNLYLKESVEIDSLDFYNRIRDGRVMPKTSMPSMADYTDAFSPVLQSGEDIICVTLTSKFSGSYASASIAEKQLETEFPGRRIIVVDSRSCTGMQGLIVLEAHKMMLDGLTIDENFEKLKKMIAGQFLYVTVDSLKYLQRGGRIGHVSAFAGGLLNIKPIITLKDGELMPYAKIRGRKKALLELVSLTDNDIHNKKERYHPIIIQGDAYEESAVLQKDMEERFGYKFDYDPWPVGPTIGSHIGPTVIGVGYIPKYEYL